MKKAIIERFACTSHLETAEDENDDDGEEDRGEDVKHKR